MTVLIHSDKRHADWAPSDQTTKRQSGSSRRKSDNRATEPTNMNRVPRRVSFYIFYFGPHSVCAGANLEEKPHFQISAEIARRPHSCRPPVSVSRARANHPICHARIVLQSVPHHIFITSAITSAITNTPRPMELGLGIGIQNRQSWLQKFRP